MRIAPKVPALSALALSIYAHFGYSEELNLDFLHGTKTVPSILQSDSRFPAGEYLVDVSLNNESSGKATLTISPEEEESGKLCLKPEWLKASGVFFSKDSYKKYYDQARDCYALGEEPHTGVEFNYGAQSLNLNIPQAYLVSKADASLWDYGTNGARLRYSGNFSKSSSSEASAFGSADLGVNLGRWVLSARMNGSSYGGENTFATNDITLSTALSQVQGDLILGRSQTRTNLFNDFGFYGAALRSNSNMRAWDERGYAPVITGVANSQSRITITQGGYTVYSKVVPAGPYRLDDVSPVSNGDLVVTVEDESGRKTERIYPVATLPSLLRPGEVDYNVAVGRRNDGTDIKDAFSSGDGTFWLGSLSYGFASTTVNTAALVHNRYQSAGLGLTQSLGQAGALETSVTVAKARYDDGAVKAGTSFNLKYAKSFSANTDLQLLTYRYQSRNYVDFADFDAGNFDRYERQKSRYEARLSHRLADAYLSASYWQQDYWQRPGHEKGATLSVSTSFNDVSLYLNGSYSRRPFDEKPDYSASLSVSVPFNLGGVRHYSNSSVATSRNGDTRYSSGVSATVSDRLNYSLSADADARGNNGATGSVSYAFDAVQTNMSLSQFRNRTSVAGSFSGSAIATPETGVLLTKDTSDTIGIVNIEGMEGVTFNGSLPTNSNGDTVVNLTEYSPNTISVNMDNVPDDAELTTTSYNVVPTEKAMIYRKFGFNHVRRYILRVKDAQGRVLDGGNAETEQGLNAGFISNNGVLLMNMLAEPQRITVSTGDGLQCRFNMSGIKANTNKVQEVRCE
ncbi:PefC/AfrB family outer membrane usher protein [Salmonella enterica subsp. enterica serovar Montevideo]|nr:PefC/AfrB family outer membrane usher protein [Salmonella enterica subsp. enterica serovar Montevideo]EEK7813089.1 PefC/AfrB family outer membrane usher protein [Salmonella enterica subsp. enterica serovar Montevideo]